MTNRIAIKSLRERNGLTIEELSRKTGISYSALFNLENKWSNPNIKTILAISSFFSVPLSSLLEKRIFETDMENTIMYFVNNRIIYPTTAGTMIKKIKSAKK